MEKRISKPADTCCADKLENLVRWRGWRCPVHELDPLSVNRFIRTTEAVENTPPLGHIAAFASGSSMDIFISSSLDWLSQYRWNVILSSIVGALYFFLHGKVIPKLEVYVEKGALKNQALKKAANLFRMLYGIVSLALVLLIWGFDFDWLIALSSGIIALTGVALFASWSFLSNITAFFILLIHDSFKRGNFIRIIEADNYVEGFISEINVFNTRLITENREYVIYPNNLLITRPIVINPKTRYSSIGKIQEFSGIDRPANKPAAPGA
jgi:hypothetical protein